jgi:alkanesulfonate monooxygenase SsuD/methylene tetrahydromethanopterin reductase-like flavin-dependent oxidoreductase (luciferase family)
VRYGIEVVPLGTYAEPGPVVELAVAAEAAGWEALAVWDHAHFWGGVGDPWVTLTAVAAATSRLRLVTAVCPLPRYSPHLLARSVHALAAFSGGRVTLGVGLGVEFDLGAFGELRDDRTRASMADEAQGLVTHWCNGETVTHTGRHYTSAGTQIASRPTQSPRVPVWVGGSSRPALRRATRWDGWVIGSIDEAQNVTFPPENVAKDLAYLRSFGPHEGFDVSGERCHLRRLARSGSRLRRGGCDLVVRVAVRRARVARADAGAGDRWAAGVRLAGQR